MRLAPLYWPKFPGMLSCAAGQFINELCDMSTLNIGILSELPAELAYLAEPAMRYGVHHFDAQMDKFLRSASKAEMDELSRLAKTVLSNNHYPRVNAWLDEHDMTEHEEAANLYFLFGLMDAANLQFDVA
jgi:hypothetical protein